MAKTYTPSEQYIRDRKNKMRVHANRLGRLCVAWSNLELDITMLLNAISGIENTPVCSTFMGVMGLRAKIQATIAMAFANQFNDDWYKIIKATLLNVDNDLRMERNRMIHDFWSGPDGTNINRTKFGPKVVNIQSRQEKLIHANHKPITPDDISNLCEKIETASLTIFEMRYLYLQTTFPKRYPALIQFPNPSHDPKK